MIYPGAVWRPGKNAGYASGRTTMDTAVCHYTVGRDSAPIGDRGYFNFLVRRNGEIVQFAEADAVTWHAGNWNVRGPGIEVEYLDEPDIFTPEAHAATAGLVEWLIGLGVPDAFYDGPRVVSFNGFITHRSLIQTGDSHSDYWPELPRSTTPQQKDDDMGSALATFGGLIYVVDFDNNTRSAIANQEALAAWQTVAQLNGKNPTVFESGIIVDFAKQAVDLRNPPAVLDVNTLAAAIAAKIPTGADVDAKAVAKAVRAEFQANPLR